MSFKDLFKGINIDQVMSFGNHLVGILAAIMLSFGVSGDIANLATGVFLAAFSFAVGVWMNGDNALDALQSAMRKALAMVLAFSASRGWLSAEYTPAILNTVATILPIVWSMLFYRNAPGPNFPGTTIVDPKPKEQDQS